ncbi:MAG TPA: GDP-mannose 4,6-dehydratase [Solirubrobacteraceae bacterium]|nr:GDP-mannose 4,6-dehydratase [Solirubrobacteraceae bacterium]
MEALALDLRPHSFLVTGGYGLLGGWLVRALVEAGGRVTVLRRDVVTRSGLAAMELEPALNIVSGDVTHGELIERTLADYEIDSVFHLAAQALVLTANASPRSTFQTNIAGTWELLEACRAHGAQRVIVASSDKAYGPHQHLPYRESHALQPVFPYDVSKAATDLISRSYWHTWGLPVAVTRFANMYGGGDFNRSRLIPEAISAALAGRSPVVRSDGSPERDFLYVEDAVAAYLAIWTALGRGEGRGEAFNAGGSRPHRVRDVVETVCRLAGTGVTPDIRGSGNPAGEIDRQWIDATKLRELTGWEPQVELEAGLERTIEWYRRYGVA